jgi:hypothetical protein
MLLLFAAGCSEGWFGALSLGPNVKKFTNDTKREWNEKQSSSNPTCSQPSCCCFVVAIPFQHYTSDTRSSYIYIRFLYIYIQRRLLRKGTYSLSLARFSLSSRERVSEVLSAAAAQVASLSLHLRIYNTLPSPSLHNPIRRSLYV